MNKLQLIILSLLLIVPPIITQMPEQDPCASFDEAKNQFEAIAYEITLTHDNSYDKQSWGTIALKFHELEQIPVTYQWNNQTFKQAYNTVVDAIIENQDPAIHGHLNLAGFIGNKRIPKTHDALHMSLLISKKETYNENKWNGIVNLASEFIKAIRDASDKNQVKQIIGTYFKTAFEQVALPTQELTALGIEPRLTIKIIEKN